MGHPLARPMKLGLPGGVAATVGAFNPAPAALEQRDPKRPGRRLHPRRGTGEDPGRRGRGRRSTPTCSRRQLAAGSLPYRNPQGSNQPRDRRGVRLTEPTAERSPVSMPLSSTACAAVVCQQDENVTIPAGGVLLLARTDTPHPIVGARARSCSPRTASPAIDTAIDDAGWGNVTDVTGGKPMLVEGGRAISSRPDSIDPWQWDCGGGCWRPALVRSGNSGWMILIGGKGGAGLTMPKFASVLADMGATDAMGFDNNNSAELWRPGHRPITGYGYERLLPTATSLSYRG